MGEHAPFLVTYEEMEALYGTGPLSWAVYLVLRARMDFRTGITGQRRRISRQMLIEQTELHSKRGYGLQVTKATQKEIRGALDRLDRAGVAIPMPDLGDMVFRLPMARSDSIRPNQWGPNEGRPMEATMTPAPNAAPNGSEITESKEERSQETRPPMNQSGTNGGSMGNAQSGPTSGISGIEDPPSLRSGGDTCADEDPRAADAPPPRSRSKLSPEMQDACRATWESYCQAYHQRYGVDPVRNAKVNRQVIDFVKRIGMEESPGVAGWFVGHTNAYYVRQGHAFGVLLVDAEKLRTEWATGRRMTQTKARQADRASTTADAVAEILAERGETL